LWLKGGELLKKYFGVGCQPESVRYNPDTLRTADATNDVSGVQEAEYKRRIAKKIFAKSQIGR